MNEPGTIRLYWNLVRRFRRAYAVGALALLAVDLLDLLPPLALGLLVDSVSRKDAKLTPLLIASGYMAVLALQNLFRYPMRRFFMGTAARIVADLRERYGGKLLGLPLGFFASHTTGDLMSRGTNDLEAVEWALGFGLLILADAVYYLLTVPFVLLALSPTLSLWALLPMPLIPPIAFFLIRRIDRASTTLQEALGRLSSRAHENAAGVQTIRAYGVEGPEIDAFGKVSHGYAERSLSLARLETTFSSAVNLLLATSLFVVLLAGGWKTIGKELTIGQFVSFAGYVGMMTWPLMALAWVAVLLEKGKAGLRRIHEVTHAPSSPEAGDGPPDMARGEIEFRRLTFQYPQAREPALEDLTLKIQPGQFLAIVGPVGSGKSTLVDLLARVIDPPPGTVFIDGRDVRGLRLDDLRRHLAVVPQDTFLFAGTMRENIRVGAAAVGADGRTVEAAADAARVTEDSYPEGLETVLGEKGVNLSGGQKQRIALARALIRSSLILILDDPFSAVDAETEEAILERLLGALGGRTLILVSHRVRVGRKADRIAVLEAGRLVEEGSHDDLLARGGLYAELVLRESWEDLLHGR